MQTTGTTLLPASLTLNRRLPTPRKTTTDGKAVDPAAMTTTVSFRRDKNCHSGCDPLRRHESAEEEVQIAKEAKGMLIGLAIIVAVLALSAVIAQAFFARL